MIKLKTHQKKCLEKIRNGMILLGSVGSGKSYTGLAYYYQNIIGGSLDPPKIPTIKKNIYILTTAKKRDSLDWHKSISRFGFSVNGENPMDIKVTIDSWNNIKKYTDIKNSFFLFDEQKASGYGVWAKSFVKIARNNSFIMLTATPGDNWMHFLPIFLANNLYKNKSDFIKNHVIFSPYTKFPKIQSYKNTDILINHRNKIIVTMEYKNEKRREIIYVKTKHNEEKLKKLKKFEWNEYKNRPIKNITEFNYLATRINNSDISRLLELEKIHLLKKKLIVFYNYNFELSLIKDYFKNKTNIAEYNGNKHEQIPNTKKWLYLVQYIAGSEGWECIETNAICFFSLNYSYRTMVQAMGRIDRLNTKFRVLYYYKLISNSLVDNNIIKVLKEKKTFNYNNRKII